MSRPWRVGQLGLAIAIGILLAWPGYASATFTFGGPFSISVTEQTGSLPFLITPAPSGKKDGVETLAATYNNYVLTGIDATTNLPIVTIGLLETPDTLSDSIRVSVDPVKDKTTGLLTGAGNLVLLFISDGASVSLSCTQTGGSSPCNAFFNEPPSSVGGPVNVTSALSSQGYNNLTLNFASEAAVPEPGTLFLLGSGLVGVGTLWGRRHHS